MVTAGPNGLHALLQHWWGGRGYLFEVPLARSCELIDSLHSLLSLGLHTTMHCINC